jgi:hypothetical protein
MKEKITKGVRTGWSGTVREELKSRGVLQECCSRWCFISNSASKMPPCFRIISYFRIISRNDCITTYASRQKMNDALRERRKPNLLF